jgi:O-antigen/teichoic acid export membrane protein
VKNIEALSIIVAGHLVFGVLGLSGQVLIGLGKSRLPLVVAVIALGISFIANLILVRILGVTGAAMSSSLVLALQGIALFFIAKRYTGFWLFHRKMLPSVSVALLIVLYSIYNLWGPIQRILG